MRATGNNLNCRRKHFTTSLIIFLISSIFSGCNHREFLYESPSRRVSVEVEFEWSLDPEANPKEMSVYFYRIGSTSNKPISYYLSGKNGGTITLSPGVYAAICHNNDSDRHGFIGMESFEGFGLHLNDDVSPGYFNSNSIYKNFGEERLAHAPDPMWVGSIELLEIKPANEVHGAQSQTVRFEMHPIVAHYRFYINNPVNFNKSFSVTATISGMAGTVHPSKGMTGEETVTHLLEMIPTNDGNLYGELLTFGHCGGNPIKTRVEEEDKEKHILTIQAVMNDGKRWTSVHDVTPQIHHSSSPDCIVRLDSVAFPKPAGNEGGFHPTVGGWTGSEEVIGM